GGYCISGHQSLLDWKQSDDDRIFYFHIPPEKKESRSMIPPNSHIGIVGYGNVGSHLSQILANNPGVELSVYNRSSRDQQQSFPNVQWVQHLGELASASTIILSASDDAIETVAKELRLQLHSNPLVCHTAGSVESDVLAPYFKRYGVLYPLQTFSIH